MKTTEATIGQSVILTRAVQPYARGQLGTIQKIIKSRKVLRVRLDSGDKAGISYDADAVNADPFGSCPKCGSLINIMGRDIGGGLHPGKACGGAS